jgi:hypothetical protein
LAVIANRESVMEMFSLNYVMENNLTDAEIGEMRQAFSKQREDIKNMFVSLSLCENQSDVAGILERYAQLWTLPSPRWCYACDRYVWDWEEEESDEDEHQHEFDY